MPTRPLGNTGFNVSAVSLGGVMYHRLPDTEAAAVVNRALDLGINYIDTAAAYDDGVSEQKIGLVLPDRRDGVFIATKTTQRDRDGALRDIERSFKNLGVDVIDSLQIHDLETEEELAQALGPGGAMEAIEEYRAAGKIRFVGLTGHRNPEVLVKGMQDYDMDTLLVALGAMHAAVRPFYETVMPVAKERGVAVVGMKVFTFGMLNKHAENALRFMLGRDGVATALVGVDNIDQLERNIEVTTQYEPLSANEQTALFAGARAIYENDPDAVWCIHMPT
jgi:aryl-alcohol dehydrogenase-like predicted oxidoreductase